MLPTPQHKDTYQKLHKQPKFDDPDRHEFISRIIELQGTVEGKEYDESRDDYWPVYKGASFDIWIPDTGEYFHRVNSDQIIDHLFQKRLRQSRTKSSPFWSSHDQGSNNREGTSLEWIHKRETLCLNGARIAIRDITNSTNKRTAIPALIPANRVMSGSSPYLFFRVGTERDQSYILGVLCSMVFDWIPRRIVETHLNYAILKDLPIPNPDRDCPLRRRVEIIAGRLATMETGHPGFKEWAQAIGIEEGSVHTQEEKEELITELDALVAVLYGLDQNELKFIYDTFHHNTDYTQRYQRALPYHQQHTHTNQTRKP